MSTHWKHHHDQHDHHDHHEHDDQNGHPDHHDHHEHSLKTEREPVACSVLKGGRFSVTCSHK